MPIVTSSSNGQNGDELAMPMHCLGNRATTLVTLYYLYFSPFTITVLPTELTSVVDRNMIYIKNDDTVND